MRIVIMMTSLGPQSKQGKCVCTGKWGSTKLHMGKVWSRTTPGQAYGWYWPVERITGWIDGYHGWESNLAEPLFI